MAAYSAPVRRYQVFVSSTYLDLKEERQVIISTLLESEAFPAGMELFPATDDDAWTLIQRVIDDSDYYILVIGGKYGSIDPATDLSFTEKEYDYAVERAKPVMAFLHGAPDSLTVEKSEKQEAMQKRLARFRSKVEQRKHVKYWTTAEQLQGQVAVSYIGTTRRTPGVGWLRADAAAAAETLAELAQARTRLLELEKQLTETDSKPPAGIEKLAQGDDKVTLPVFVRGSIRLLSNYSQPAGKWIRVSTTWDQLLGVVGPSLLMESESSVLKDALDRWFLQEHFDDARKAIVDRAKQSKLKISTPPRVTQLEVELDAEEFGTVLIQLKATGLIEESGRKRSIKDTGSYWKATRFGEQRIVQVRAIKRTPERETELGVVDEPDDDGGADPDN